MLARILTLAKRLRNLGQLPFHANGNCPRLHPSVDGRRGLRLVRHMRGRGGTTRTGGMSTDELMELLHAD
ncbi:hypothetical protein Vlu01_31440 [Micromonospora lutea]|uniref:Uncharacterized protein n=1 Tax=Micromonospora lutea TaxID=419825 RepID=A0ABQ4IXI4_9ACTN|nr:hypothetical protein Vlu01_31440 [Micromonospora lutea]